MSLPPSPRAPSVGDLVEVCWEDTSPQIGLVVDETIVRKGFRHDTVTVLVHVAGDRTAAAVREVSVEILRRLGRPGEGAL